MLPRTIISTLGFALLGASTVGCAARGGASVHAGVSTDTTYLADTSYATEPIYVSGAEVIIEEPAPRRVVFREPPPLVVVEPDVYVVEDSSYAIYFVGGFYWHVGSGGRWYRTSRWDEPWVHVDVHVVPPRISHRDHHAYVHFRASASAKVWRQPRERGGNDRALRIVDPKAVARARAERERKREVESHRIDMRNATPAAGPKPERRTKEHVRREREQRRAPRVAPKVDPDIGRRRVEPAPRQVERDRVKPMPRRDVDRVNPRPELDRNRPRPQPDQARPDDKKKKKVIRKKPDEKRKPKEQERGRPRR